MSLLDAYPNADQPWAAAEERRLAEIYRNPKASPVRVFWPDRKGEIYRYGAKWRASRALGRTPEACDTRFAELERCRKRRCG